MSENEVLTSAQTPPAPTRKGCRGCLMWAGIVVGVLALVLGIFVGWTWVSGTKAKKELAAKYPPPGQMVDVGGYRLHLNCQGAKPSGDSPTVVMEGGHMEPSLTWALVQPEVARFTRVCTYDRAGLGWSERSPKPRTVANMVDELHTLLARAGVEPPYVLVGHSIGGLYVRLYAHNYPDQVAGMVLVDASHEEQDLRFPKTVQRLQQQSSTMMVWGMRLLKMSNSIGLLALFAGPAGRAWATPIPQEVRSTYLGVAFSDTKYFETATQETAALEENFAAVRAAKIETIGNIPLVVLSAGLSPIPPEGGRGISAEDAEHFKAVSAELHAELAALSPRGKRLVAERSGHYIHVDQPELVIEAIREVVEAVRRR